MKKSPTGLKISLGLLSISHLARAQYLKDGDEITIERFEERNAARGSGARERIQKLEDIMANNEQLERIAEAFHGLYVAFNSLEHYSTRVNSDGMDSYNNPAYYSLLKYFNPAE